MTPHAVYLNVPDDVFDELIKRADEQMFGPRTRELLFAILRDWMAGGSAPSSLPGLQKDFTKERGYQWKELFLPEGTLLRHSFLDTSHYAQVMGENIICEEVKVSPSQFVNMQGGGNRNAWLTIWLRFPNAADWRLANKCRATH